MKVDTDEEEGGTIGVHITNQPAVIYVSANMCDRGEGSGDIGGVVHGQEKASEDLGG